MLVDLHVHTNASSRCSNLSPLQLVERARDLGLDAVAVTEHSTFKGAQENYDFAREHDFRIFRGMEVYTEMGDMLVFGWSGNIRYYLYPFNDLKRQVDEAGGILIPAHPCRGTEVRHPLRQSLPDDLLKSIFAIETHNGACKSKSNEQALALKEKYGLFGTGGSDAHHVTHLGRCVTVFEDDPEDEKELIEVLRTGRYRACAYGEIDGRTWPEMSMRDAGYEAHNPQGKPVFDRRSIPARFFALPRRTFQVRLRSRAWRARRPAALGTRLTPGTVRPAYDPQGQSLRRDALRGRENPLSCERNHRRPRRRRRCGPRRSPRRVPWGKGPLRTTAALPVGGSAHPGRRG